MLQVAVLLAARHVRHKWVTARVVATVVAVVAHVKHVKCIPLHAQAVAMRHRYPSSLVVTNPSTAETATRHNLHHPAMVVQATVVSAAPAGKSRN